MSRQRWARHRRVAVEIARGNTSSSSSEYQISIWKVFSPLLSLEGLLTKWLFVKQFSFFLPPSSDLSAMSYYFRHAWGSIGAEKGNYTASDLCMTVGFGLGLKVGGRMSETSHSDVTLVQERTAWVMDHQNETLLSVRCGPDQNQ